MTPDDRESVQVDLPEDVLFTLMLQAHEQDITLNQHVNNILRMGLEQDLGNRRTDTSAE